MRNLIVVLDIPTVTRMSSVICGIDNAHEDDQRIKLQTKLAIHHERAAQGYHASTTYRFSREHWN